MKTQTAKKLAALAITFATALSVTQAFAQTSQAPTPSWRVQSNGPGVGKTRAQVYAELVQAQEAGVIPTGNAHSQPSATTIETNRIRFALAERAWKGHTDIAAQ
jgi:hypothetical protein